MNNNNWKEAFTAEFGIHFKGSSGELNFALSFIEDLLDKQKQEMYQKGISEGMRRARKIQTLVIKQALDNPLI